jgi:HPt (histidine-containing phosphotransfer) domain-containing protein
MTPNLNTCETGLGVFAGQRTSESSAAEVLDLEDLRNRCMGNIDFVQRVLAKFQQQVPKELAELEQLLEVGDVEQVARVAHRVKGTSANVAAPGLRHAAAAIEELGRTGRMTEISHGIKHMRDEWEKYLDYVSTLVSTVDANTGEERLSTAAQS